MIKSMFCATLSSLVFSLSANALNFDEYDGYDVGGYGSYLPDEPPARTYKSAQGYINLDMFEDVISGFLLGASVEITEVRWPYNPLDYTNYLIGSAIEAMSDDVDAKFGTYVIYLRVAGKHEGRCELLLFPGMEKGRIQDCKSSTSKIRLHHDFDFQSVNLR